MENSMDARDREMTIAPTDQQTGCHHRDPPESPRKALDTETPNTIFFFDRVQLERTQLIYSVLTHTQRRDWKPSLRCAETRYTTNHACVRIPRDIIKCPHVQVPCFFGQSPKNRGDTRVTVLPLNHRPIRNP
jgi:hypothetical protein